MQSLGALKQLILDLRHVTEHVDQALGVGSRRGLNIRRMIRSPAYLHGVEDALATIAAALEDAAGDVASSKASAQPTAGGDAASAAQAPKIARLGRNE